MLCGLPILIFPPERQAYLGPRHRHIFEPSARNTRVPSHAVTGPGPRFPETRRRSDRDKWGYRSLLTVGE